MLKASSSRWVRLLYVAMSVGSAIDFVPGLSTCQRMVVSSRAKFHRKIPEILAIGF
jgi:hypothetical protein